MDFLGARGEDVRFDSIWRGSEKVHDQLSVEELAKQWEFSIADPRTPVLVEELFMDKEDVAEDEADTEDRS